MSTPCYCCCYEDFLSKCIDDFTIYGGLTPGTTYKVVLENKFGQLYTQEIEAGDDGELVLSIDEYPDGMLNEFAGSFNITVTEGCDPVNLTINGKEYTCIDITIKNTTDKKSSIPCS